jgi:hypothetical protein
MMAPDYTHWHGTYDLAKHFYTEFIPEIEELIRHGSESKDQSQVLAAELLTDLLNEILNSNNHNWYIGKLDPDEKERRKKAAEEFKARYK